jgi:hypothetical protein
MGRCVATDPSGGGRFNGSALGDVADGLRTFIATAALDSGGVRPTRVPVRAGLFPSRRRVPPCVSPNVAG